jgi:microcystin-dependent protein
MDAWFRQASTVYAVGDMRCYESLPYGWYLECTTAGTTGSSDITIPSPLDVGDTVTDGTVVWTIRKIGSGDGFAIGDIKQIAHNGTIQDGWLECDGRAVSRTMFPDLFDVIGTTYGAGDGSTTFNLPNYSDGKFPEGSTVAGVVKQPGLPNITGAINDVAHTTVFMSTSGAFRNYLNSNTGNATSTGNSENVTFDASRSSSIYGNSDTVQPKSLTTRFIIKAYDGVTPTPAEADISNIFNEIARLQLPTGTIIPTANDVASPGFLICDGSEVSRETYSVLFNAIGTKYGVGDGSTTFNLPDSDFVADKSDYVPVPVIYGNGANGTSTFAGKQACFNNYNLSNNPTAQSLTTEPSSYPATSSATPAELAYYDRYSLFADISSATATTKVKNQIKYS